MLSWSLALHLCHRPLRLSDTPPDSPAPLLGSLTGRTCVCTHTHACVRTCACAHTHESSSESRAGKEGFACTVPSPNLRGPCASICSGRSHLECSLKWDPTLLVAT